MDDVIVGTFLPKLTDTIQSEESTNSRGSSSARCRGAVFIQTIFFALFFSAGVPKLTKTLLVMLADAVHFKIVSFILKYEIILESQGDELL